MKYINFTKIVEPPRMARVESAWAGLHRIMGELLDRYQVGRNSALEFGVCWGFSTVTLSNYFNEVTGIDIFDGGECPDDLAGAQAACAPYKNIKLVKSSYQDWIAKDNKQYDLIHCDADHSFKHTYELGKWAIQHAPIVIFHDVETLHPVKPAVEKLAQEFTSGEWDNFPHYHGLGILRR